VPKIISLWPENTQYFRRLKSDAASLGLDGLRSLMFTSGGCLLIREYDGHDRSNQESPALFIAVFVVTVAARAEVGGENHRGGQRPNGIRGGRDSHRVGRYPDRNLSMLSIIAICPEW
jgi:hypothetical protein